MLIGYARTSTTGQQAGLEAQIRDLKAAGCEKVFSEQCSSVKRRPELDAALEFVREGDSLVITKLDRIARNVTTARNIAEDLDRRGVGLRVLQFGNETLDTKGATGKLMLNLLSAVAEFERDIMLERQREGIEKAKREGRYLGRKPTAQAKAPQVLALHGAGKTPTEIAREVGIGRASVYRIIEQASLAA